MAISLSKTFLLRKLHQLTGIAPLGIFLAVHLFTNTKAMNGGPTFNHAVQAIHEIPLLLLLEIFGIFLPLMYHAVYGLLITAEWRVNLRYPYARNWFYVVQRITGIILFVFILFHLLHFRFGMFPGIGLTNIKVAGNAEQAFNIIATDFHIFWVMAVYVIGITATVWHLANGLWLFSVDWGIVIGERAQRTAGYVCAAIGAGLLFVGINAAVSFVVPGGLLRGLL